MNLSPRPATRYLRGVRILKSLLIGIVVLGLLTAGVRRFARARTVQLAGRLVARVETRDSVVALSFDDGPVPEVADGLHARGYRVTTVGELLGDTSTARRPQVAAPYFAEYVASSLSMIDVQPFVWLARSLSSAIAWVSTTSVESPRSWNSRVTRLSFTTWSPSQPQV